MTAYLGHISKVNPELNAIVSLQDETGLLKEADQKDKELAEGKSLGWMHGFPIAPKDLTNTKKRELKRLWQAFSLKIMFLLKMG